jgi:hypothetical protein
MTRARLALSVAAAVMLAWGVRLLLGLDPADLVDAALWLAGGVLVHDLVLAPVVVLVGLLLSRRLPALVQRPVAVGLVVVGTVTLALVPTLGRFGAKPDDPYLLDRDYLAWWVGLVGLAVVLVAVRVACSAATSALRARSIPRRRT